LENSTRVTGVEGKAESGKFRIFFGNFGKISEAPSVVFLAPHAALSLILDFYQGSELFINKIPYDLVSSA